ncbi:hypothetical protein [Bacillus xiapuensis]|uniref:hypothetical protein n=1 Tax=Bacillus xiapuensis TaxID=2014075 RepID=UPI000C247DAC|nr:hypothetical protein [Bacillus xiapuensis]
MVSESIVAVQIGDLITGAISRRLNNPDRSNHKDKFANYVLQRLNLDYIRHEASEIDNGKTEVSIEPEQDQNMFYVHIFE